MTDLLGKGPASSHEGIKAPMLRKGRVRRGSGLQVKMFKQSGTTKRGRICNSTEGGAEKNLKKTPCMTGASSSSPQKKVEEAGRDVGRGGDQ